MKNIFYDVQHIPSRDIGGEIDGIAKLFNNYREYKPTPNDDFNQGF